MTSVLEDQYDSFAVTKLASALPASYNNGSDDPHRASNSVLSIPPEILSVIFELGKNMVSDNPLDEEGLRPHSTMAFELAVSQICAYLRSVALGTPELWTSVQIEKVSSLKWASVCIGRTGDCGLDIFIDLSDESLMDDASLESILALIVPHSKRWRSLSIGWIYERIFSPIVARFCGNPAPSLQYLSLEVNAVERTDRYAVDREIYHPQIFKSGTPSLKFVRLRGMAIHICRPQLDNIVTLHLDDTTQVPILYSTFCGIITQSPFLEHLSIYGDVIDRSSWPGRSNVIRLPRLRSLRLCGVGGEMYAGILLGTDAPSLESLTIKDMQDEDLDMLWHFNDGSRYSNLTHLIFHHFDLSSSTYKLLCQTFRNIISFSALDSSIVECPMVSILMEGVLIGKNGKPFLPWPALQDVAFSFDGTEEENEIIRKLVHSRKMQGLPLSRFRLRVDPDGPEDILEMGMDTAALCEYHPRSEIWPHGRCFFDYNDTIFLM